MMLKTLFSVDIWQTKFPDLDYLRTLEDKDFLESLHLGQRDPMIPRGLLSSAYAWEEIRDSEKVHLRPEFQPLTDFMESAAKQFWDSQGFFPDRSPKIYQSWVNIALNGGMVLSHSHYEAYLAAVVYVRADADQGNIVFENPMELMLCGQPIPKKIKKFRREIPVETGDVLIFPGYIRHFTLPNRTDDPRISFSFNFNTDGHYHNANFPRED
jgi:uncharacterized protein (TIGR02466 family)